jgi:hypothetical protein
VTPRVAAAASPAVAWCMRVVRHVGLSWLLAMAACKSGAKKPPAGPPPTQIISQVRGWADRACACQTDRDCMAPIVAEWEAAKWQLRDLAAQLPPSDRKAYDDELTRFSMCGDAAGVTVWKY